MSLLTAVVVALSGARPALADGSIRRQLGWLTERALPTADGAYGARAANPTFRVAEIPNPQQSQWRGQVDLSGLAAANLLTAQLRAAQEDIQLQNFINHAADIGQKIDDILSALPNNIRLATRSQRMNIALESVQTSALLYAMVGKAIVDFKVALSPSQVTQMVLRTARPAAQPMNRVQLRVGDRTSVAVFLGLLTHGGQVDTPRGLARSFLLELGVADQDLEGKLTSAIRGTISDRLQLPLSQIQELSYYHPNNPTQRDIYLQGFYAWMTSPNFVIQYLPQPAGWVDVTHNEVVRFAPNGLVGTYRWRTEGADKTPGPLKNRVDGMALLAVNPGITVLGVELTQPFKPLYPAYAELAIEVIADDQHINNYPPGGPGPTTPNLSPPPGGPALHPPFNPNPNPGPASPPTPPGNHPTGALVPPEQMCTDARGNIINPASCEPH